MYVGNRTHVKKMDTIEIVEKYFSDKHMWHVLSETEAKELFDLLPAIKK